MENTSTWVFLVILIHVSSGALHSMCDEPKLIAGGLGSHGDVVSPFYPKDMIQSKTCRMTITACAECRITLNFTSLKLPNCTVTDWTPDSCVYGCYHMYVHDPDYPVHTASYYFNRDEGETYTSVSNRIYLVLCVADRHYDGVQFRINYHITRKIEEFTGSADEPNTIGYITSPNFPRGYAMRNEVFTYLIQNTDPDGLIRLGFDDWSLSQDSTISIFFNNDTHPEDYLKQTGKDQRPFILSKGPKLFIQLETGEDLYSIPYIGFKAFYQFVKDPHWPDKPNTICGDYYHSLMGGHISFKDQSQCLSSDLVDCMWVVMKYEDLRSDFSDAVSLHISKLDLVPGKDSLEIRSGNSSQAQLVGIYDNSNFTSRELISTHGFYVRLRSTCFTARQFEAVFTSFSNATSDGCDRRRLFECSNNRCISTTLKCDGYDHCGDNSDEVSCTTTSITTTGKICSTHYPCSTGRGWYCVEEQCDGNWDCSDGSDERNCWMTDSPTLPPSHSGFLQYHNWGTYIPIALVAILLAIIACIVISCCARRKHTRRRRQQRALANRMGIANNVLPGQRMRSASETHLNINVDTVRYPEAPPTYEEAMQTTAPVEGVQNLAYTRTDSNDTFMPLPPPYTPNADDPLPIIYQLAASQSAPDIHSRLSRGSNNPTLAGVHLNQSRNNTDSERRRSRSRSSQEPSEGREGRRLRGRHRRRRSRGTTSQNPAHEDQSALIYAAQDTATNSSIEDDPTLGGDDTQPDAYTQQHSGTHNDDTTATNINEAVINENICDNTLTENVMLDNDGRSEFIELGDNLTIPSGVDVDRLTLQSETSGSFYSGADSASGCSTLDHSSSCSSLNKGKTHRRSVSGVSCISKTSMEPSVSKVDEEPCESKCSCKCECKPGENYEEKCNECSRAVSDERDSITSHHCDSKSFRDDLRDRNDGSPQRLDFDIGTTRNATASQLPLERNDDSATFV